MDYSILLAYKSFLFTLKQLICDIIKDGDFALTESVAMMRYLARTREVADHWYPKGTIIFCT